MTKQISGKCDKCGRDVEIDNDATVIWAELTGQAGISLFFHPRHFLPSGNCPGSPSRAQYIKGQPRDNRGYGYDPKLEPKVRKAYAAVRARYAQK